MEGKEGLREQEISMEGRAEVIAMYQAVLYHFWRKGKEGEEKDMERERQEGEKNQGDSLNVSS